MNLFLLLVFGIYPLPAHAYLDPATGSIVLQALIGGIATGLYVIKLKWQQLKAWYTRSFGCKHCAEEHPAELAEAQALPDDQPKP